MKFRIYEDIGGDWRWNAQSGGNIIFTSGDAFEKPQKIVQTIRKNVVRGDEALEKALVKALKVAGLNEKGGQDKTKLTPVDTKIPYPKDRSPRPVKKLKEAPAWPFPTGNKK